MPISRFVAVSLRPASSVRRRTFASTGRVLRLETARDTTDRPRARFSCMTESFTCGVSRGLPERMGVDRSVVEDPGDPTRTTFRGQVVYRVEWLVSIFSFHHHRHIAVDVVDGHAPACGAGLLATVGTLWTGTFVFGDASGAHPWMNRPVARNRPQRGPARPRMPTIRSPESRPASHGRGPVVHRIVGVRPPQVAIHRRKGSCAAGGA